MKRYIGIFLFLFLSMTLQAALPSNIIDDIKKESATFQHAVQYELYTQEIKCQPCKENDEIIMSLAKALGKKVTLKTIIFDTNSANAKMHGIDKIPALALSVTENPRNYFFGSMSGYLFGVVFETTRMLATGQTGLSEKNRATLKSIQKKVHMQVLATPTCPNCPKMAILAQQCARANQLIRCDVVNLYDFSYLGNRYAIRGVPYTIINEKITIPGIVSEDELVAYIVRAGS